MGKLLVLFSELGLGAYYCLLGVFLDLVFRLWNRVHSPFDEDRADMILGWVRFWSLDGQRKMVSGVSIVLRRTILSDITECLG